MRYLLAPYSSGLACQDNGQFGTKHTKLSRLEMRSELAKCRQDAHVSRTGHDRFVLKLPGVLVRDVHGVEPDLHRRIDVAARAVSDHPRMSLHDFVLVHQGAVGFVIFLGDDFDELEKSLEA